MENGFFEKFVGGDGMKFDVVINEFGVENLVIFVLFFLVGEVLELLDMFNEVFKGVGGDLDVIFVNIFYDVVFLLVLVFEKVGGDKVGVVVVMLEVFNGEGEVICLGEWVKVKELIVVGIVIDYKGVVGDYNFDVNGDVFGIYVLFEVGFDGFEVVIEMK